MAEPRVERKRDRRQPDRDQRRRGEARAPGRQGRLGSVGRRDQAARGFGASAVGLPLRQEPALNVAPDFLELRLYRTPLRSPLRPLWRQATGEAAAIKRRERPEPPSPPGRTTPFMSLNATPGGAAGKSRSPVIAKRSLGLVKMEQPRPTQDFGPAEGLCRGAESGQASSGLPPSTDKIAPVVNVKLVAAAQHGAPPPRGQPGCGAASGRLARRASFGPSPARTRYRPGRGKRKRRGRLAPAPGRATLSDCRPRPSRRIGDVAAHRRDRGDRGNVNDRAASASPHERQRRPDACDHASDIDVEDAADERIVQRIEIAMRHEARRSVLH